MKKEKNNFESGNQIAIFKGKEIRKTIFQKEWWFSVIDIVGILTESVDARDYWYRMKVRVENEEDAELSTVCRQLKTFFGFDPIFHPKPIISRFITIGQGLNHINHREIPKFFFFVPIPTDLATLKNCDCFIF